MKEKQFERERQNHEQQAGIHSDVEALQEKERREKSIRDRLQSQNEPHTNDKYQKRMVEHNYKKMLQHIKNNDLIDHNCTFKPKTNHFNSNASFSGS